MPIQGLTLPKDCPACGTTLGEPKQTQVDAATTEVRCAHCDALLGTHPGKAHDPK